MKKYRILALICVIALLFTSCITKEDIEDKQDIKQDVETEIEKLEEEYQALEDEYTGLSDKLDELTKSADDLTAENIKAANEIEELKKTISDPPFQFLLSEFIDNLTIAIDGSDKASTFMRALSNDEPEEKKLNDACLKFVYELKGDADSDRYIVLTFIAGYAYKEVYDITVEYSSDIYKDDYDELINAIVTAVVMITEDPYNYERKYLDAAKDILDEGDYFNKCIRIEQKTEEEKGTTKIYCRNY